MINETLTCSADSRFTSMLTHHGGCVFIYRTYDTDQQPCWFALRSTELKIARLGQTTQQERIDLTEYGQIIASGWGHTFDEEALND